MNSAISARSACVNGSSRPQYSRFRSCLRSVTSPGRRGLLKCRACRKQFTVTVGTVFEDSHVKLTKWIQAIYLIGASKKGISAHQLHRMLGVTYCAAWFMAHRLRLPPMTASEVSAKRQPCWPFAFPTPVTSPPSPRSTGAR
jgi:transposase-like protein